MWFEAGFYWASSKRNKKFFKVNIRLNCFPRLKKGLQMKQTYNMQGILHSYELLVDPRKRLYLTGL